MLRDAAEVLPRDLVAEAGLEVVRARVRHGLRVVATGENNVICLRRHDGIEDELALLVLIRRDDVQGAAVEQLGGGVAGARQRRQELGVPAETEHLLRVHALRQHRLSRRDVGDVHLPVFGCVVDGFVVGAPRGEENGGLVLDLDGRGLVDGDLGGEQVRGKVENVDRGSLAELLIGDGEQMFVAVCPLHALDRRRELDRRQRLTCAHVPDLAELIGAGGREELGGVVDVAAPDTTVVALVGSEQTTRLSAPHQRDLVHGRREDEVTLGVVRHVLDGPHVTVQKEVLHFFCWFVLVSLRLGVC
eukprot:PhM_4_TR571/c0_g1_i1/m.43953